MNIFTDGGREFGQYPFSVYGDAILKFYTFVIPLALFQYYPLLYILERETSRLYMLAPVPAVLFAVPAYIFWRFGVRKYKSTGS
jgi:ABC-2 type transport system permease protein